MKKLADKHLGTLSGPNPNMMEIMTVKRIKGLIAKGLFSMEVLAYLFVERNIQLLYFAFEGFKLMVNISLSKSSHFSTEQSSSSG